MHIVHAQLRPHVQLQPHQQEGIEQMIYMEKAYRGGILADDVSSSTIHIHDMILMIPLFSIQMGLGKVSNIHDGLMLKELNLISYD